MLIKNMPKTLLLTLITTATVINAGRTADHNHTQEIDAPNNVTAQQSTTNSSPLQRTHAYYAACDCKSCTEMAQYDAAQKKDTVQQTAQKNN